MTKKIRLVELSSPIPTMEQGMPHLADRVRQLGVDPSRTDRMVFATRSLAKELVSSVPLVDCLDKIEIDATDAFVMTPTFADEVLHHWPNAFLVNANDDVQWSWNLAVERRRE